MTVGCTTFRYTANKDFEIPVPTANKIPIRIGLYKPLDVCQHEIIKGRRDHRTVYQFGDAICNGIERILSGIFNEVVALESIDSDVSKYGVKAIVVPEIVLSNVLLGGTKFQDFEVLIRIKYTVTDNNKKILWMDTFQGEGRIKQDKSFIYKSGFLPPLMIYLCITQEKRDMLKGMQLALEDHFRNALVGMLSSRWWESIK
jgi:hypothetical protein